VLSVSFKSLKCVLKAVKQSVISCFETDNYSFCVGVEQVTYNYLNTVVITYNCVNNAAH
jgi:hypothetical protein